MSIHVNCRRIFDCFLYNNEVELLEIRLLLLSDVVDCFVVVCANETFTGKSKDHVFPWSNTVFGQYKHKVKVVVVDKIPGNDAWDKERYSRNRISDGLEGALDSDIIMVSDIDEIPRPTVLEYLQLCTQFSGIKVLGLDYFNFKFNYQMIHGLQAVWAGPVVCKYSDFTSPQKLRDLRWQSLTNKQVLIENAGWHFSYLTEDDDVVDKLNSFSHQEKEIQGRKDSISDMISTRQGFHDHIHAGSVWAVVSLEVFDCHKLRGLISQYPNFIISGTIDDEETIKEKVKLSIHCMYTGERTKVLRCCTLKEILHELASRFINRLNRVLRK